MNQRARATWVTYREVPLWCLDFSEFGSDRAGLIAEIAASEAVISRSPENSLLVAVALHRATVQPELASFFGRWATQPKNSIRKMAILYVSRIERIYDTWVKGVSWPRNSKFFDDYEAAKEWLISERF